MLVSHVPYLPRLVVEPYKSMIPGQHLAVKCGVVLGWSAPSHRPTNFDRLIQVHMPLLEWVRVGSAVPAAILEVESRQAWCVHCPEAGNHGGKGQRGVTLEEIRFCLWPENVPVVCWFLWH
ncbi:hypothetical protein CHARACLAT_016336 [Characodon lateralis]|uniref:Uncharacterized protein n=1 Tax=Characodon lateralis TaxID=208331 RepID=A0ABU7EJQ4_9TELE|nr:hypothetical protein [Characodon lateralis]